MPIMPEQRFAHSKYWFVDHQGNALLWFSVMSMCIAAPDEPERVDTTNGASSLSAFSATECYGSFDE